MASRIVFRLHNTLTQELVKNPATGAVIYRMAPFDYVYPGYAPPESVMYSAGWDAFTGDPTTLSQACIVAPTPTSGDPVWIISDLATLYTPVAGAEWSVNLYFNQVGQAAAGQTINTIGYGTLPGWLSPSLSAADGRLTLIGNIPASLSAFDVPLILYQSDGKSTPKTFRVNTVGATVYMRVNQVRASNSLTIYLGADGTTQPSIQMINAPGAFTDRSVLFMNRLGAPEVIGFTTYYFARGFTGLPTGHYDFQVKHLGATLYGSADWVEMADSSTVIGLSATAPALYTPGTPQMDGTVELIDPTVTVPPVTTPPPVTTTPPTTGSSLDTFQDAGDWEVSTTSTPTVSIDKIGRTVRGGSIYHYVKVTPWDAASPTLVYARLRNKVGSTQNDWTAWTPMQIVAGNSQFSPDSPASDGYQLGVYSIYYNGGFGNDYTLDAQFSLNSNGSGALSRQYYFPAVPGPTTAELPTPESLHTVI